MPYGTSDTFMPDVPEFAAAGTPEKGEPARSVLYINDNWEDLAFWRGLLDSAGYSVFATDSPASGLSAYLEDRFDAVILAFQMPFVSSGLLATVMRLFRHDTPLILMSESPDPSPEEIAPFDLVLRGDADPAELLGILHNAITPILRPTCEIAALHADASAANRATNKRGDH